MMVDSVLTSLQENDPDLEIVRIDIVTNPSRTWKNGIRMIPALKSGEKVLSGIFLSKSEIRDFVATAITASE